MRNLRGSTLVTVRYCLFIFAAWVVSAGCVDFNIRNLNSSGKNIICFGDSLTAGYGAERERSYPVTLARLTSFNVINAGLSGDNTREALLRLETDVIDREPLMVIVEFGGNDLLGKLPLEETIKNMGEIVDKSQGAGAMVAIVDISADLVMEEYGQAFRSLARGKGAIFIRRAMDGIITDPSLKSDYMHPNSYGYKIMAHRIYRAIMPYLNRNLIARNIAAGG